MLLTRNARLAIVLLDFKNTLYLVKPLHFGSVPLSQKGEKAEEGISEYASWLVFAST